MRKPVIARDAYGAFPRPMTTRPLPLPLVAFAFALAPLASVAETPPPLDYTIRGTYLWTENLGRASGPVDFRDTSTYRADFAIGASKELAAGLGGRLQLEAGHATTPDFERLDESTFGPRASLRKKFGLGPEAPVLSLETAALGRFARIDENDGVTLQGALTLSKRFNPVLSARLRGEWQERVAVADTFDVHHCLGEACIMLDPTDRVRVAVGGGYLTGTFTAGASAARFAGALGGALGPEVAAYYTATPKTTTDAFQPGWINYRVEGDVAFYWLEIDPALTDSLALSLRFERNHATNTVNVEYRQDIFSASLVCRF